MIQYEDPEGKFIEIYNSVCERYYPGLSRETLEKYGQILEKLLLEIMKQEMKHIHPLFRLSVLEGLLKIYMDKNEYSKGMILIKQAKPLIYEALENLTISEIDSKGFVLRSHLYSAYNTIIGLHLVDSQKITAEEINEYIELFTLNIDYNLFQFFSEKHLITQLTAFHNHRAILKQNKYFHNFQQDYWKYLMQISTDYKFITPIRQLFLINLIESLIERKRYKEAYSIYKKNPHNLKKFYNTNFNKDILENILQKEDVLQLLFSQSGMNEEQLTCFSKDQEFYNSIANQDYIQGKKLLLEGADINYHPRFYNICKPSLLINAIKDRNLEMIHFFINNGVDIDFGHGIYDELEDFGTVELPPLQTAINLYYKYNEPASGSNKTLVFSIIKLLLDSGANPNKASNFFGKTPLMTVIEGDGGENIRKGEYEIIELLLNYGANPNIKHWKHYDCMYIAQAKNDINLFIYLAQHGGNIRSRFQGKYGLIHKCAMTGTISILDYLISQGQNINSIDSTNHTPLDYAILNKKNEMIQHIKSRGGLERKIEEDKMKLIHERIKREQELGAIATAIMTDYRSSK